MSDNKKWMPKSKRSSSVAPTDMTDEELEQQRLLKLLAKGQKDIRVERALKINMQNNEFKISKREFVAIMRTYRFMRKNHENVRGEILLGNFAAFNEVLSFDQAATQVAARRARKKARKASDNAGTSTEQYESSDEDSDAFYEHETDPANVDMDDIKCQPKDDGAGPSGTQNRRHDDGSEAEEDGEEHMRKRCGTNVTENTYLDNQSSTSSPAKRQPTGSEKAVESKEGDVKLSDIKPEFVERPNDGYVNKIVPMNVPEDEAPIGTQLQQQENQIVSTNDDPVQRQEPTVQRQEPAVQRQEPTVQRQEPTVQPQEPTVQRQEPTVQRQEPTDERQDPTEITFRPSNNASEAQAGCLRSLFRRCCCCRGRTPEEPETQVVFQPAPPSARQPTASPEVSTGAQDPPASDDAPAQDLQPPKTSNKHTDKTQH